MAEPTLGDRLREIQRWHRLILREGAGLGRLSVLSWGRVERGEKAVSNRRALKGYELGVDPEVEVGGLAGDRR